MKTDAALNKLQQFLILCKELKAPEFSLTCSLDDTFDFDLVYTQIIDLFGTVTLRPWRWVENAIIVTAKKGEKDIQFFVCPDSKVIYALYFKNGLSDELDIML